MNKTVKKVAYLGIGIALYVVLSMAVKIPLISHIQTDLGYIAFGVYLYLFGVPAVVVGVIGCLLESLLVTGWVPIGWMVGQAFIGITCGFVYRDFKKNNILLVLFTIVSVFIGVGVIKTVIECYLYNIPFMVKIVKNTIATAVDIVPMVVGLFLGKFLEKKNLIK